MSKSTIYASVLNKSNIQVNEPLDARQAKNNGGGYSYVVSPLDQVKRFVILGSEGGTFYVNERSLTLQNADCVKRAVAENGPAVVNLLAEISENGIAPKMDALLLAFAIVLANGDDATLTAAEASYGKIVRTMDHQTKLVKFIKGNKLRGMGRRLRRILGSYYTQTSVGKLALHAVKYPNRNGYSHGDLLKIVHQGTTDQDRLTVWNYMRNGWESVGDEPHDNQKLRIIWAAERAKLAKTEKEIVKLIQEYDITMEMVPTNLRTPAVYEALLQNPNTGLMFITRNLANMTRHGALVRGQYGNLDLVIDRLTDKEQVMKARLHPLNILTAWRTYATGRSDQKDGFRVIKSTTWEPIPAVNDALEEAFYLSFHSVEPTGKRFLQALDISGSMDSKIGEFGISCREGAGVMAMVRKRTEKRIDTVAFDTTISPLALGKNDSLATTLTKVDDRHWGGGATDCAKPIRYAMDRKIEVDVFEFYTDSETNRGNHPMEALRDYRQKMGIDAKMVVVGMTSSGFTIGDPADKGTLDVVGFDPTVPAVISEFAKGNV